MNALGFALRSLLRDLRAGELTVLLMAMIIAVTAMTAVSFFTARVGAAIRAQASEVLAADFVLQSAAPVSQSLAATASEYGLDTTESMVFLSVVMAGGDSVLSNVTAADLGYPLRGRLLVSEEMFGETRSERGVPARGEAWAEPGLLGRLGIDVGAAITIGELELTVTRVLEYKPDATPGGLATLAPGVLVNIADVPAMGVVRPGSRVTYRLMLAGEAAAVERYAAWAEANAPPEVRLRGRDDAGEQITAAINRAERFLSLASLVTVVLAAVATAMAARRYALRHLDTVALMKCLGGTQGFILACMLLQLGVIVIGTALAGSAIGFAGQYVLTSILGGYLNIDLPDAGPAGALLGLVTAATVAVGFALPHLLELRSASPIRVLRRDLPPPQLGAGITYGVALGALVLMIWWLIRDLLLMTLIVGGLAGLAVASVACGWLLVRALQRLRGAAGVAWRYGLANIARRGGESIVQIVAFGLSLMVLLLLTVVRNDLLDEWQNTLPEDAPNYFLINIAPENWPAISAFIEQRIGTTPEYLPLLRGRYTELNGVPVGDIRFENPRARNFAERETNLTWKDELPAGNRVTAGAWWDDDNQHELQVSLEESLAGLLQLELGDTVSFSIGGEPVTTTLTSLRSVEWDSLGPNFYIMLSPGAVGELPQTYLSSLHVPADRRALLRELVRQFPGMTVLDLEVILGQVRTVMDRASLAVQYVFLFTLLAGVVVLLAAIQMTRDERRFESAILHTLGASRGKILQGVAVEFVTLGLLAGTLAAIGATVLGMLLAEQVFELDYVIDPRVWFGGLVAGAAIVGITGTLATRKAVSEPPVAVLREA